MKDKFQSKAVPRGTRTIWRYLSALFLLFIFAIGNVWGAETSIVFSSENKNDANAAFGTFSNGNSITAGDSIIKIFSTNNTNWAFSSTNKKGYRADRNKFVFHFTGETDLSVQFSQNNTNAVYLKLAPFTTSKKYMKDIVISDFSTTGSELAFASVAGDSFGGCGEPTISVADNKKSWSWTKKGGVKVTWEDVPAGWYELQLGGTNESYVYGFSADVTPSCSTEITTQPSDASLAIGDANPELSIVATHADAYAWKESSDGTSYDGSSTLGSAATFTPSVNDAVQTKYYYCEVTSDCDGTTVVKSDIVTVEVVASIVHVTGVSLDKTSQEFTLGGTTTTTLTATVAPNDATNKAVSWESSAPTKVSVTDNGDGTAEIEALAEGTATITVTTQDGSFTATCDVTVNPDPCHKYFYFTKAADATTAGVTNNEGSFFTVSASGSNGTTGSIILDGKTYNCTNRTSNVNAGNSLATFTIPSNKKGDLYGLLMSSGDGARGLLIDGVSTGVSCEGGNSALHNIEINNITSGAHTLTADGNTRVGMFIINVCDATYHTITLDLDGGTGATSIAALDGVPAIKPADPTKEHADFVKWIVKSTEADYNWSANVTGDLTLKAVWSNWPTLTLAAGEGATGDPIANKYKAGTEITVPEKPEGFSKGTDVFTGWAYSQTVTVTDGKFDMPSTDLTLTAQWQAPSDFDVKFFQGYGDPDAQIGETQSISTGNYATAPDDPTRTGYAFLGWSYDATEAHIVDVATYGITAATNFTAMWKAVWTVTFDGAGAVNVEDGETVASPDSPTQAGKVFQGWYNGESKYDFSAAVTGNLALTSKWADADPNHYVYAYNDDFHFDGVVYKTPEGKVDNNDLTSNKAITTPYTLFSGAGGITSIVATGAIYDSKGTHVNAFLKLDTKASSYLTVTIASGYTAVMKVKMGSWNVGSAAPTVTFVDEDDTSVSYTGTMEGKAEDNNYAELTYNLSAGTYKMTTASKTLYFSNMDIEATALPTHTVTYKAGEGTGDDVEDADATNVADVPSTFTAPTGKVFNGWKDESDNDVAVGAIVEADMTLTAQWINHYAVTFNMNGHGDAPAEQDIKHGEKAAKPADPSEIGWIFGGWFTDNGTFEAPFDFETPITAATPLFAKWTEDPCPTPFSLSKVVLTSATDGTVTGYNNDEYAGEKVIGGLGESQTADVDPSHEGVETGYKLSSGGSAIVFATLKKGTFQVGDRVVVTITKAQDAYKVEEVAQPILDIYYGTDKNDATFLTTIENVTAAGTYTYRLTAADVTAIGSKTGIGVFRPSSGRTQNPYVYSVEIKGCREWAIFHTLTFKNIDGTATIATESLEEGAYASTVAPVAPKIAMKRFLGWAEDIDGTPVELTSYTITEDKTLYAVYENIVCPTTGTVYKFQMKTDLTTGKIFTSAPGELTLNTTDHLSSMVNGEVTVNLASGKNTNRVQFYDGKAIGFANGDGASITLTLDCALATGDEIRFINYAGDGNKMNLSDGTHSLELNGNSAETVQKITVNSDWNGADELTLTRGGNTPKLTYFEIYRPAKFDVSFNMMGHGTQIADIEDVIEGSKITAPTAPTDEDYSFAGWYKENTLANEWKFDVDVVEANTTLYAKWLDKSDATLKSLKYGETEIALEAGVYIYNVSLPAFTSAVPALTAETSNPSATKVIANAAAFDSEGNATSTVTVTPEVGADQVYYVNFAKGVEILLQDVTGSITWNFANAVTGTVNITGTPQVLANYGGVTNDNTFESDKLKASGEKFTAGNKANLRANYIHFHTTVPGMLTISYSNTGGNTARYIYVNGAKYDEDGSENTTPKGADNKVFVPAGDVELVMKDGEDASKNVQIYQMIFNATPDYTRPVTEGRYGTICLPNGGVMTNATIYTLAYFGETSQKFFFDEVLGGVMEAGKPYLFLPEQGVTELKVFYTDSETKAAQTVNGFVGFIGANEDDYTQVPDNEKCYIIQNNTYRQVLAGAEAYIKSYRAYIDRSEDNVPLVEPAKAPGARRIGLGKDAAQGFENLQSGDQPMKVMIDGTLYIIRGEKVYNANGQVVK